MCFYFACAELHISASERYKGHKKTGAGKYLNSGVLPTVWVVFCATDE